MIALFTHCCCFVTASYLTAHYHSQGAASVGSHDIRIQVQVQG